MPKSKNDGNNVLQLPVQRLPDPHFFVAKKKNFLKKSLIIVARFFLVETPVNFYETDDVMFYLYLYLVTNPGYGILD